MTETHIRILFHQPQPELLLETITASGAHLNPQHFLSVRGPSAQGYFHCAKAVMAERSDDELMQFYYDLEAYLNTAPAGGIFSLLGRYSEKVLLFPNGVPQCRMEKLLNWRELSFDLGQDLFTCSGLAWKDAQERCRSVSFCWPAAIRINCAELYDMLSKQLSENHYHLNASTQCFPLTWGFLMNHPNQISRYFGDRIFREDLHQTTRFGSKDNVKSWSERMLYAAFLRALLFQCVRDSNQIGGAAKAFFRFINSIDRLKTVRQDVENLRFLHGARFVQLNGLMKCLDYAISPDVELGRPYSTRFLSGERQLLYNCFKSCYTGRFPTVVQNMFYLYLLIKLQFRQEIIQCNKRYGFRNFSEFQDRKAHVWGDFPEYWSESYRLSISSVLESPVHSLEMRVMAGNSLREMKENISLPDRYSYFHQQELNKKPLGTYDAFRDFSRKQNQHFFVLHFAKQPLERVPRHDNLEFLPTARHQKLRNSIQKQAQTIAHSMERDDYLCSRIRGIDAASHEIGCRPEVFATAFRFLRGFPPAAFLEKPRHWPLLGATYHAGEDFLDIVDGLRAIDEAICFLNLECGDRIGHALALGIDSQNYYTLKNMYSVMPVQDLLDNLTWLLFRCMEWGVDIPYMFRTQIEQQAEELLKKLYWKHSPNTSLRDYFYSWTLRGDDPGLLLDSKLWSPSRSDEQDVNPTFSRYAGFMRNQRPSTGRTPQSLRSDHNVLRLLYRYQFGRDERLGGQAPERFLISNDYIDIISRLQERMMQRLMDAGICIECNPSSNILIGTFRKYEMHPIFRFNSFGLHIPEHTDESIQLRVSINTDDQGIFDTSLENEYALLYCSLCMRKDIKGAHIFSQDAVYNYLDHIRILGNGMVFPKAVPQQLSRLYV